MLRACLDKRICRRSGQAGSHLDLSCRDLLKLILPFSWTVAACCLFSYYTIEPLINMKFPKSLPMYWTLISALPAFMTALNVFVFYRDGVVESGLSRAALSELSQVMRLVALMGNLTFIALAIVSAVQAAKCRLCDHNAYAESIAWCAVALAWTLVMAWTTPTSRHFSKLIFRYETHQQQLGGNVGPTLCFSSTEASVGMGRAPMSAPVGIVSGETQPYVVKTAMGYPLDSLEGGAARAVAPGSAVEEEYIRAAAGAPPTQIVTGKVSTKIDNST